MTIGILAYGSLLGDPGTELACAVRGIENVQTPFRVEFARKSRTRDGGPTLVPVNTGGAAVMASVLVLKDAVDEDSAHDMLYRRETQQVGAAVSYLNARSDWIHSLSDFGGVDVCLYAAFKDNISTSERSADKLAKLAIKSASRAAGMRRRDGISYLESQIQRGVKTPLMPDYEREVLSQSNARTLGDAWARARAAC
jgi:hypothetical protein